MYIYTYIYTHIYIYRYIFTYIYMQQDPIFPYLFHARNHTLDHRHCTRVSQIVLQMASTKGEAEPLQKWQAPPCPAWILGFSQGFPNSDDGVDSLGIPWTIWWQLQFQLTLQLFHFDLFWMTLSMNGLEHLCLRRWITIFCGIHSWGDPFCQGEAYCASELRQSSNTSCFRVETGLTCIKSSFKHVRCKPQVCPRQIPHIL